MNISKESAFYRFLKVLYGFGLGLIILFTIILIYFSFQGLQDEAHNKMVAQIEATHYNPADSTPVPGGYKPTLADIDAITAEEAAQKAKENSFKGWLIQQKFAFEMLVRTLIVDLLFFVISTIMLDLFKNSILYILYNERFSSNSFIIIQLFKKLEEYSKTKKTRKNNQSSEHN